MKPSLLRQIFTGLTLAGLLAAGCSAPTALIATTLPSAVPATAVASETPAQATAILPMATATAASTPSVGNTPTGSPTAAATVTGAPPAAGGAVISPQNVAALTSQAIKSPAYIQMYAWTAPDQLLTISEAASTAFTLNPLQSGQPEKLPLTGRVVALAPDGSSLAAIEGNGPVALYDLQGKLIHSLGEDTGYFANYAPDGKFLVTGMQNQIGAYVFSLSNLNDFANLTGFETAAPVYNAVVAPGGKTLVWISRAKVQFQDTVSKQLGKILSFTDFVLDSAFSPDGSQLALTVEGNLEIYSVPEGSLVSEITLSQPARMLAYSPDGKLLAAGYGQGIQLWETATWTPLTPLSGHSGNVVWLAFSPDGTRLVSMDENQELREWMVKP